MLYDLDVHDLELIKSAIYAGLVEGQIEEADAERLRIKLGINDD